MELSIDDIYSVDLLTLRKKLINEETEELNVEIDTLINELKTTGYVSKETKLKMFKELADLFLWKKFFNEFITVTCQNLLMANRENVKMASF